MSSADDGSSRKPLGGGAPDAIALPPLPPLSEAFRRGPQCPDVYDLELLLPDADRPVPERVRHHVYQCSACQKELALLARFQLSTPGPDERANLEWMEQRISSLPDAEKSPIPWWRVLFIAMGPVRRWLLLISAIVAIVSGALQLRRLREPAPDVTMGRRSNAIRDTRVELIAPAGELTELPQKLQWAAFAGAARYRVTVSDVDGVELWHGETSSLSIDVPAAVKADLLPNKTLLWRVHALDPDGVRIAYSSPQNIVYVPDVPR